MESYVLDTVVWTYGMLNANSEPHVLIKRVISGKYRVLISSYGTLEILNVLERVANQFVHSKTQLKRDFWTILALSNVVQEYEQNLSKALVKEVRQTAEIRLIAQTLDLEPKDVPFIVLAFKHNIPLVTEDKRSLLDKRGTIEDIIGVKIVSVAEIL